MFLRLFELADDGDHGLGIETVTGDVKAPCSYHNMTNRVSGYGEALSEFDKNTYGDLPRA